MKANLLGFSFLPSAFGSSKCVLEPTMAPVCLAQLTFSICLLPLVQVFFKFVSDLNEKKGLLVGQAG